MLSMTLFWTWNAINPGLQPAPTAVNVPTKVILQASWVEPAALRDETSPPVLRMPAKKSGTTFTSRKTAKTAQKPKKPLWTAAKSHEIPPILWAGLMGFLAGGLGILSLHKK
jgi:hypothetical protein